jgi:energy-coupling factor transporter ATP-binding protein EcfA2
VLDYIVGAMSGVRTNLRKQPVMVTSRPNFLTDMELGHPIGLKDVIKSLGNIWSPPSTTGSLRPRVGMLNAPSGSGKSTLLQCAEQAINAEKASKAKPLLLALTVTFNHHTGSDDARVDITPEQGLVLRIAERFLCENDGAFVGFRDKWMKDAKLNDLPLPLLLDSITTLCDAKVMVLVDEPGLAGCPALRLSGNRTTPTRGYLPEVASELFRSTGDSRGCTPLRERKGVHQDVVKRVAKNVRFVFSSLTPIFNKEELSTETKTGSEI